MENKLIGSGSCCSMLTVKCTPLCEVGSYLVWVNAPWSLACLLASLQVMLHRTPSNWVRVSLCSSVCLCVRVAQLLNCIWLATELDGVLLCPAIMMHEIMRLWWHLFPFLCVSVGLSVLLCTLFHIVIEEQMMNPLLSWHTEFRIQMGSVNIFSNHLNYRPHQLMFLWWWLSCVVRQLECLLYCDYVNNICPC